MSKARTDPAKLRKVMAQANENIGKPGTKFTFDFDPENTPLVPWRDSRVVPAVFSVTVDDPGFPWVTRLGIEIVAGQPRCNALALEKRDGGQQIAARSMVSVPLSRYMLWALTVGSYRVDRSTSGQVRYVPASKSGSGLTFRRSRSLVHGRT